MKRNWTATAVASIVLAVAGAPAGAADTLKCGGTKLVKNPEGFDLPATYDILATGVNCDRAKRFIGRYLESYNPPKAPAGFRCTQDEGRKGRTRETCKNDDKKIVFDRDEIG